MAHDALLGKLSSQALNKAVEKTNGTTAPIERNTSFRETLSRIESGAEFAEMLGIGGQQEINPTARMRALEGADIAFTPDEGATGMGRPDAQEKLLDMLGEVNKGQMQMDSLVNHVLYSGRRFSNQELLVIQAHVFHFAQMTELTVKVAEQGVSSIKALLNTQVQ